MSPTCRVTVNGRTVEVPAGTLVTEAARVAQTHVPIFCSHSKLPPLGACRICVVEAQETKGGAWVEIACNMPVSSGMKVFTESDWKAGDKNIP